MAVQLLDKTQPNPKFNFYTHSYNTNLNDLNLNSLFVEKNYLSLYLGTRCNLSSETIGSQTLCLH